MQCPGRHLFACFRKYQGPVRILTLRLGREDRAARNISPGTLLPSCSISLTEIARQVYLPLKISSPLSIADFPSKTFAFNRASFCEVVDESVAKDTASIDTVL